jgi:cytochrome c peroxidase
MRALGAFALFMLAAVGAAALAGRSTAVSLSAAEREAILSHGPWPLPFAPDPSNRASGNPAAIGLGRSLFFDTRLSRDGDRSCASCHDPAKSFTDSRPRSIGIERVDRNAIALANVRLNRWYGWSGASDNLWAQSLRPILDPRELGATAELVRQRLAAGPGFAATYATVFGSEIASDAPEPALVNLSKALAAFQETISSGRTAFDDFRDAFARGDAAAMSRYPMQAQRGLRIFVGKGQCTFCHFGPNFTNGEFDDVGVRHFAAKGRVDRGRYGGIAALRDSRFNLLGPYNDDAQKGTAAKTSHVEQLHRNWGEFRVPSLRNVADTAPYMHDGSLQTLQDVVRHYSEVDVERLHGDDGQRLIRPLRLSASEAADLVEFLRTLSGEIAYSK